MALTPDIGVAAEVLRRRKRPVSPDDFAECADALAQQLGVSPTVALKALLDVTGHTRAGSARPAGTEGPRVSLDLEPGDRASTRGGGLFLAAVSTPTPAGQVVHVSLSDERGISPVGAAAVEVEAGGTRFTASTDAMGAASLRDVPLGVAHITARAPERSALEAVSKPAGQVVAIRFGTWEFAMAAGAGPLFAESKPVAVEVARQLGATNCQIMVSLRDDRVTLRLYVGEWISGGGPRRVIANVSGGGQTAEVTLEPGGESRTRFGGEAPWAPGQVDLAITLFAE